MELTISEGLISGLREFGEAHLIQTSAAISHGSSGGGPFDTRGQLVARLVQDTSAHRFDVLPLLVATDSAIRDFGHDCRRLRPNIIIGGVEGLTERSWPGQVLRIGDVIIGVEDLRMRCVMTTFDPDTQQQDRGVLKEIVRKFDGKLALNCYVIQGGKIRVGDGVQLVENRKK